MEDWLPVAERLKKLCADNGLLADPAVTTDAARVLRIPTTHNHKDTPPTPVGFFAADAVNLVDFDDFSELLGNDPIPVPKRYVPDGNNAVMTTLNSNMESTFREMLRMTQEGRGCEQMRQIVTEQAGCTEPMWRAGLSIAKFCTDADKAAHVMSSDILTTLC